MSQIPNIKDLVKDNLVQFDFYRAGVMYYTVSHEASNYRFPVPLSDVGDASLVRVDKAILFMRYIRKAIDSNQLETVQP